jgi:GAF domain-containing protein
MVVNILTSAAVAMAIIGIAVWIGGNNPLAVWVLAVSLLIDIVGIILAVRGITLPGRVLMPGILTVAIALIAFTSAGLSHISILGFPVIIVLAGLLLGIQGSFIFAALTSIAASIIGYADINGLNPFSVSSKIGYDDIAVAITLFFVTAIILRVIIQRLTESIQEAESFGRAQESANDELIKLKSELEQRVEEHTNELNASNKLNENRAKQFEAIAQVARSISSTKNFDSLLPQITSVVSREFGYYHVGIFLLDTAREYAVLSATNSEGGRVMLERGHRLKVGEKGLVGFVASTGKPRVALDTGADAIFFNNPDLPETHSEVALPLRTGEEIIGVLDVQSVEPSAFSRDDVNILSTLADQVSIAIQNARQNEETRKALAESDALSHQFVQAGWSQFTKRQNLAGIRHTSMKTTLLYTDKNAKEKDDASAQADQLKPKRGGGMLSLPIKLRGEVIGSVDIRATDNRQWDQDELDIITAIIERAAIAMENSRLLEEAQRRASREQAIGEMSAYIGTFTDTEAILRATVDEIGQKIGGARVVFELDTQDRSDKRRKSK